jgi:hypothetical protein
MPDDDEWTLWWGWSSQPERLSPANSREDAIEQAIGQYAGVDTITFCEGKHMPLHDECFDADWVLERWHECNEDVQDEDGELYMEPTEEQNAELELVLTEALREWRKKHNLGRAWGLDTRNEEIITLPQEKTDA